MRAAKAFCNELGRQVSSRAARFADAGEGAVRRPVSPMEAVSSDMAAATVAPSALASAAAVPQARDNSP